MINEETALIHTKTLLYQYRQINDMWIKYASTALIEVQELNYLFAQNMRSWEDNMRSEIENVFLNTMAGKEKIAFVLTGLLEEVQKNIGLYNQRKDEFAGHAEYFKKHQKELEKKLQLITRARDKWQEDCPENATTDNYFFILNRFETQIKDIENKQLLTAIFSRNIYKDIYQHSNIVEKFILRFHNNTKNKNEPKFNYKVYHFYLIQQGFGQSKMRGILKDAFGITKKQFDKDYNTANIYLAKRNPSSVTFEKYLDLIDDEEDQIRQELKLS